ncbi:MAG: DUF499 domain-containing protein [Verrucomicrobiales bacterium]|nr:DUF499 domain-containing protein [Verrucomicrobiales bacterium]
MAKQVLKPWKEVCTLRSEIRTKTLTTADFAVDLHRVIFQPGSGKYYTDPDAFFATTYATPNLRKFCADVLRRLAGEDGGEPIINMAQTFGGGKSHTLTALYYLTTLGEKLPRKATAVQHILAEAKLENPPEAVVAPASFDKFDWKKGLDARAPDGALRTFRMPWNVIAWQLLGQRGLEILDRDETQPDYDTPPADRLWTKLLQEVEKSGKGALILLDEFLMWAHDAASPDPEGTNRWRGPMWIDRLKNFFQRLAQAVEGSERSCLVVSLLATEPSKMNDEIGKFVLDACNQGLNRQASVQSPVEKGDLAELLRRRMFEKFPENPADRHPHVTAFWDRMRAIDPAQSRLPNAEEKLRDAYPFHPDLLARFFGKWTELHQFQRTRGVLQTFASALREAEKWDTSPLIGPQVFLGQPESTDLSPALQKLAEVAKDSQAEKNPQWPNNLKTELPRVMEAQKAHAGTLTGRELEAACVAAFIYSQPIGEQAEAADLRWLLGPTCDLPAVLNNGLIAWAKTSWYLEETDATDPATNVPKYWRLGPKPNLNQVHFTYKQKALSFAKGKFDELAKKCGPLKEGCDQEGIKFHNQPNSPGDVDDDGVFRLVVLGAGYAGQPGTKPHAGAESFLRTHSSPTDNRTYQNVVLVVTPSVPGLQQAEQQIADWLAWQEIKQSKDFKDYESHVKEAVNKRERESKQAAETAVKNAYELALHVDKTGAVQVKKFTMGAQSLFPTLLQEKELRLFKEKIDAEAIMPGGPYTVWPANDDSVHVSALYQQFARRPNLPKLLNPQTVTNTIADAVQRGVLAMRHTRPDSSEQWFWRCKIDVADWEKNGEAWLPNKAVLNSLSARAVLPESLPGLWPDEPAGVDLATLCSWFDGKYVFKEMTQPGYPPEPRVIPQVAVAEVHKAVAQAVKAGDLWLVFGNDSVWQEEATTIQLDPAARLFRRPPPLNAIEVLPGALKSAWSTDTEPKTTVAQLYFELRKAKGNPWPPKAFINTLSEAIGRGLIHRATGTGALVSLVADGTVALAVKSSAPVTQPQTESTPGRKLSARVSLSPAEFQNLADDVSTLSKSLAGCDVQFEVAVSIKTKSGMDLTVANEVLEKVKPGWGLS